MRKVLVCSNHGRAIAQVLMAAIAESGIGILGQPLEFKNNDKDMGGFIVDNFDILKINPTNGPEVKRGKGKVKRW
jgi:hypothetical protein